MADARSPRDGRFIEKIGTYNPLLAKDDAKRIVLDGEAAKKWLAVGAQPTDRVARFLDAAGIKERAARSNPNKGEPGEKAKERAEERAEKAKAAEGSPPSRPLPRRRPSPSPSSRRLPLRSRPPRSMPRRLPRKPRPSR